MNIPSWAVTVGLVVVILCALAWLMRRKTEQSGQQSTGEGIPINDSDLSTDSIQISVPQASVGLLLKMIEDRIHEIGSTYHANGQNYQDDLEISALRAMARQLGSDFLLLADSSGFSITRHVYTSPE